MLRVVVVLAMLGYQASAQEDTEKSSADKIVVEINGQKVEAEAKDGTTVTIRANGDDIEIDTDGDGEAEERIPKGEPAADEKKIAWLGVKTNEVSPELAAQLELDGGAVIEMVVPDSPADKAGLEDFDVITKIGDVDIFHPQELAEAIRSLDPGSEVNITCIRKAKSVELKTTLGSRPAMPRGGLGMVPPEFQFGAVGPEAERMRKEMEDRINELMREGGLPEGVFPGRIFPDDIENGADVTRMSSSSTSFSDGNGSITITTKDGATQLKATDAGGKLLYDGPAETEDDRKKLPPEVLEKLERFEKMNIDMDFNGKGIKERFRLQLPKIKPAEPKEPALLQTQAQASA